LQPPYTPPGDVSLCPSCQCFHPPVAGFRGARLAPPKCAPAVFGLFLACSFLSPSTRKHFFPRRPLCPRRFYSCSQTFGCSPLFFPRSLWTTNIVQSHRVSGALDVLSATFFQPMVPFFLSPDPLSGPDGLHYVFFQWGVFLAVHPADPKPFPSSNGTVAPGRSIGAFIFLIPVSDCIRHVYSPLLFNFILLPPPIVRTFQIVSFLNHR